MRLPQAKFRSSELFAEAFPGPKRLKNTSGKYSYKIEVGNFRQQPDYECDFKREFRRRGYEEIVS
jgi:hypothetical protein